jgi:ketosteroid isomerase-like protein
LFDSEERRTGPLQPFEKRVLIGFVVAAIAQAICGPYRASVSGASYGSTLFVAAAIIACGVLWLRRFRRAPGGAIAVPAGLLLGTAGLYSGYSAMNTPFVGVVAKFSVPLLLILLGAALLFAEQESEFQRVPLVLAAIVFVIVQVVLTNEARSGTRPVPNARTIAGESAIIAQMEQVQIARAFVEAINAHDPKAIVALTTPDHHFIDSLGHTIESDKLLAAWQGYFGMVPDYTITVTRYVPDGDDVIAYGTAAGRYATDGKLLAENEWSVPAAWRARIRDGKIAEWQVYADNEPIREIMRRGEQR